jgi:hypothetical protein
MSEVMSFGNLVNALKSVRHDYNEHLKTVPQYEAFLLVESSTQKGVETLQGLVNSPAASMAAEVISSLELAKTKFKEHLTSVPEYRALLAVDKLISDVSIDLGVLPDPAQTMHPKIEIETLPNETAPARPDRPELNSTMTAAVHVTRQPEVAEIGSPQAAAATAPEPDLAVSAAEHPTTQPEVAEIGSPQAAAATAPEPDLAVSAAEHPTTQPEIAEIASPREEAGLEAEFVASVAEHAFTRPRAAEITATQLPAPPFDGGSGKAA